MHIDRRRMYRARRAVVFPCELDRELNVPILHIMGVGQAVACHLLMCLGQMLGCDARHTHYNGSLSVILSQFPKTPLATPVCHHKSELKGLLINGSKDNNIQGLHEFQNSPLPLVINVQHKRFFRPGTRTLTLG